MSLWSSVKLSTLLEILLNAAGVDRRRARSGKEEAR
jgi:hypothetical protein